MRLRRFPSNLSGKATLTASLSLTGGASGISMSLELSLFLPLPLELGVRLTLLELAPELDETGEVLGAIVVYCESVSPRDGAQSVTIGILLDLRDRCITGTVVRY